MAYKFPVEVRTSWLVDWLALSAPSDGNILLATLYYLLVRAESNNIISVVVVTHISGLDYLGGEIHVSRDAGFSSQGFPARRDLVVDLYENRRDSGVVSTPPPPSKPTGIGVVYMLVFVLPHHILRTVFNKVIPVIATNVTYLWGGERIVQIRVVRIQEVVIFVAVVSLKLYSGCRGRAGAGGRANTSR